MSDLAHQPGKPRWCQTGTWYEMYAIPAAAHMHGRFEGSLKSLVHGPGGPQVGAAEWQRGLAGHCLLRVPSCASRKETGNFQSATLVLAPLLLS